MRRQQLGCHSNSDGRRVACQPRVSQAPELVCPGRCVGSLPGRYPGSLDLPAHLPPPPAAKPQARREMYLDHRTGADD